MNAGIQIGKVFAFAGAALGLAACSAAEEPQPSAEQIKCQEFSAQLFKNELAIRNPEVGSGKFLAHYNTERKQCLMDLRYEFQVEVGATPVAMWLLLEVPGNRLIGQYTGSGNAGEGWVGEDGEELTRGDYQSRVDRLMRS